MRTIFDNEFLCIEIEESAKLLVYTWKAESSRLSTLAFAAEAAGILEEVVKNGCTRIIGNDLAFRVAIKEVVREQISDAVEEHLGGTLEKFAHVTIHHAVNDYQTLPWQDRYFATLAEAIQWASE
jgi:hypothetical protein